MPTLLDTYVKETAARILSAANVSHEETTAVSPIKKDLEDAISNALSGKVNSQPVSKQTNIVTTPSKSPSFHTEAVATKDDNKATKRKHCALSKKSRRHFDYNRSSNSSPVSSFKDQTKQLELSGVFQKDVYDDVPLQGPGADHSLLDPKNPPVPIWQSVTPNHIVCLEDGAEVQNLRQHLKKVHRMTPEHYRDKWGLPEAYPMAAPNFRRIGPKLKEWIKHSSTRNLT